MRWHHALWVAALAIALAGCPDKTPNPGEPTTDLPFEVHLPDAGPDTQPAPEDLGPDTAEPDVCPVGPVTITPADPGTLDPLKAVAPEQPGPVLYTWFEVDGEELTQLGAGALLPASATAKGRTIQVSVASSVSQDCEAVTAQTTIGNTPPSLVQVLVSPSAATVAQALSCSVPAGAWVDPDKQDEQVPSYQWVNNGEVMPGAESPELMGGYVKGDSISCRVTPSDGEESGDPVESAPIPILNSPPQAPGALLECPEPGAAFECHATGDDADGDDVSFVFDWRIGPGSCATAQLVQSDGEVVSGEFGSTLQETPPKGALVFCCATPRDSDGLEGATVISDACPVPNTPPAVTGALVQANGPPVANATLSCEAEATDADGDILATTCQWFVDGESAGGEDCLLAGEFKAGQTVCCKVTADDGDVVTVSEAKTCAEIADSPPVIDQIVLQPSNGDHCVALSCAAAASDADGDEIQITYSWAVDGEGVPGAPTPVPDETVSCTGTPVAAGTVGESATASVTVINNAPSLAGVNISADPAPVGAQSLLTCVPVGWTDVDVCDTPVYAFSWYVNGKLIEGVEGDALVPDHFGKGDAILCLVAPGDGYVFGATVQSAVAVAINTAPVAADVSVTPQVGNQTTEFTCLATVDDPDEDEITWLYTWSLNGELLEGYVGETIEAVPFEENGAQLTCTAQPLDPDEAGDVVPSKNAAVLVNAPPKGGLVDVTPADPSTLDPLVCSAIASDPDGDDTAVVFEWFLLTTQGPVGIDGEENVLPAASTSHFESIYCRATPNDGKTDGVAKVSKPVTVVNTPPTLAAVQLIPAGGTAQTVFTCATSGFDDVDGDPETITVHWFLDGVLVADATQPTLKPADAGADVGATVSCSGTPHDGFDDGPTVASNPAVLSACVAGQEGQACSDENKCTTDDTCIEGACVGTPVTCNDNNACTADGCEPAVGCVATPTTAPCDDNDPCTEADACKDGACAGAALSCDDNNPCTVDKCSDAAGCLHFPGVLPCEDGDPCTVGDLCSNGECGKGGPKDCDDNDPCTADSCDGDCVHTPTSGLCDDGNPCTSPDLCAAGDCIAGGVTDCDDGDTCTADGCDPDGGCTHAPAPAGVDCDDGEPCTTADACESGACKGGPPPTCDDENPCTSDECKAGVGCVHGNVEGPCKTAEGATSICVDGVCCTPSCGEPGQTKECGDDGCGGSCGECVELEECVDPPGECSGGVTEGMVLIPSGNFWMGCNAALDSSCGGDEYPYHQVKLAAFEIDATEVTMTQFADCVDEGDCDEPGNSPFCLWNQPGVENHPVNCVDWYGATAYCDWAGKRLCTEAEWEKAARGKDGRLYPWGNDAATCAMAIMKEGVTLGCGLGAPWPVGLIAAGASPYGALDMAGNVSEWVNDWYGAAYYQSSPISQPPGAGFGLYRVYRGGDYEKLGPALRTSKREFLQPDNLSAAVGVRCCKDFP